MEREKVPASAPGAARWCWLAVGVVAGILLALLASRIVASEPSDPAFSIAREAGVAIPAEQLAAFEDGVISDEELEEAGERWVDCAAESGVDDLTVDIRPDGWGASHSGDFAAVAKCEVRHFRAIATVYQSQYLNR